MGAACLCESRTENQNIEINLLPKDFEVNKLDQEVKGLNNDITDIDMNDNEKTIAKKKYLRSSVLEKSENLLREEDENTKTNEFVRNYQKKINNDNAGDSMIFVQVEQNNHMDPINNSQSSIEKEKIEMDKFKDKLKEAPILNDEDLNLLENLGQGSFGIIKKAFNKKEGKFVALKYFKDQNLDPAEIINEDNILNKVQSIYSENSDYFLKYYGLFQNSKKSADMFCVLQMENGDCSLDDLLNNGKIYDIDEAIYLLKKFVKGFLLLKGINIAHCDIKPQNIIISNIKSNFIYKIADFGLACEISCDLLTHFNGCSPAYAAPEVLKTMNNDENYDPYRSDVYSLGKTILKMMNNLKSTSEITYQHNNINHKEFVNILSNMLIENPENRIAFEELDEKLKELSDSKPKDEDIYFQNYMQNKDLSIKEHYKFGISYMKMTCNKESVFHFNKAIDSLNKEKETHELDDDSDQLENKILHCLINYYNGSGQYDKSNEIIEKGLKECKDLNVSDFKSASNSPTRIKNKFAMRTFSKGSLYLEKAEFQEAEKCFSIFDKLSDQIADITLKFINKQMYGILYYKTGKFKEAVEKFNECLNVIKNQSLYQAIIFQNLGKCYEKMHDFDKAIEFYDKFISLYDYGGGVDKLTAETNFLLGRVHKSLNKDDKSEQYFTKAKKILKKFEGKEYTLEDLEKKFDKD